MCTMCWFGGIWDGAKGKPANQTNKAIQLYKKVEKVVIGSAGYATYVTKKAISINENINAYAVLAINEKSVALGKLTEVPAKTPIIVEGTAGEYPCTVIEEAEDPAINLLQVSDGTVTGDGAIYALANKDQGVGFYPVGNGIVVPAGKAYLNTSSAKNQVKGFLALGGLADAINNIAVEKANGTIFNIAGQKVQNITKGGLYIVNGKKVVVKWEMSSEEWGTSLTDSNHSSLKPLRSFGVKEISPLLTSHYSLLIIFY